MRSWHIITGEYPPQPGGVSDYTFALAGTLAAVGDEVNVWCPGNSPKSISQAGVSVRRELGHLSPGDLKRADALLNEYPQPRRVLVQWVPHAYGYRSMNVFFCLWIVKRKLFNGDNIELMVHEPFLPFSGIRVAMAAVVHRLMVAFLLFSSKKVWLSIPGWESKLRPYTFGRAVPLQWLPISSNLPAVADTSQILAAKRAYGGGDGHLVGHFGTYGQPILHDLVQIVAILLQSDARLSVLLLGRGSREAAEIIARRNPKAQNRIHGTGEIESTAIAANLCACDLLIQPFPDGVSSRRTSLMAGLALGRPIVTSEGEWTESLWKESGAVSLVKAGENARFAEETLRLLRDPDDRERLGKAAKELYETRFDLRVTTQTLLNARETVPQ
jgi:glycosyltransferase involved in cell wall biosynthesis